MTDRSDAPPRPAPSITQSLWRAVPYVLIAAALYMIWAPRRSGPDEGKPAAAFDLPVLAGDGARVDLDDLRGTPVVIEVFASWCHTCERGAPTFNEVAQATRAGQVRFLAISVDDDPAAGREAARRWGIPCTVLHDDGRFARDYGISLLPTVVVLGADGTVLHTQSGPVSKERYERWLTDLGAGRS